MSYDLIDLVGKTPLVRSRKLLVKPGVTLLFKLEGQNPGGSVKDRAALNMIRSALEAGRITKRTRLVEATSGNTGIALAMIARLYGIEIELIMPENATRERVQTMRAYGARVTLTPADGGIEGARDMADQRVQQEGFVMLDQFSNPDNWKAHYKSTGPEIWKDTQGKVTHFVSSMGTTGTIMGTSSFLKEKNPEIAIVGVQPDGDSSIPGIRKWPKAYLPKIFDASKVDRIIEVSAAEARETAKALASEEGIFAGMSSGGATAAALKLAEELKAGIIVSIICDRGDRYLSSDLFE
jgi:cysteine synthase B